jgi:hypothetical protein
LVIALASHLTQLFAIMARLVPTIQRSGKARKKQGDARDKHDKRGHGGREA